MFQLNLRLLRLISLQQLRLNLVMVLTITILLIASLSKANTSSKSAHISYPKQFYYYTRIHNRIHKSLHENHELHQLTPKEVSPTLKIDANTSSVIATLQTKTPDAFPYLFYKDSNASNNSSPYILFVGNDKDKLEGKLNSSNVDLMSFLNNYYFKRKQSEKGSDKSGLDVVIGKKISGNSYYNNYFNSFYYNTSVDYRNDSSYSRSSNEINADSRKVEGGQSKSRKGKRTTAATTTTAKPSNEGEGPWINDLTWDDATWILTASFIIFTMQTGFGMLESGCVSVRNESNIMMKNVVDVVFGGLTYWMFGFSISFGTDAGSTPFYGVGEYLVDSDNNLMGPVFAAFMFQLSFATTATTIVSGTMAERCNFKAYCVFSLLNTVVYCVPARWVWGPTGFLGELGVIDIAGSGAVHLLGGVSGFTAAWLLGPRLGRYENGTAALPLGNPTSCIVGLYILWWGWLAFNSGSTFGVSGVKWKFAARAATTTLIASLGGGLVGSLWTLFKPGRIFEVMDIVNPVLGALVGVTAGCALYHTIDAFIVGIVGGIIVIVTNGIPDALRVDDPVGATAVHGFGGLWGLVAVAIFAEEDQGLGFTKDHAGFLRGGDFYLIKVQLFAALCIIIWSFFISFTLLWVINKFVPIRMEPHEELLGADFVEHMVLRREFELSNALAALASDPEIQDMREQAQFVGACNPAHETINDKIKTLGKATRWKRLKAKTVVASAFMTILQETHSRRVSVAAMQNEDLSTIEVVKSENARESYDIVQDFLGHPFTISEGISYQTQNQNYNSSYANINSRVNQLNNGHGSIHF